MLETCLNHNLKVLGSWFQHRLKHRITWYSNTGRESEIIDHILISCRLSIPSDCRVLCSAELGNTDHRLFTAALHLRPHLQRIRGTATPRPPDTDKLHDPFYANRYAVEVANRFAALDNINEISGIRLPTV